MLAGIAGVFQSALFGPQQPTMPMADTQAEGPRAWQYTPGYNLPYAPRAAEGLTPFSLLINLAELYDTIATDIAYWIEQIAYLEWQVIPVDPDPKAVLDPSIADDVRFFLQHLDGDETRDSLPWFITELLREAFTTDAVAIHPQRTRGGDTLGMFAIDGSTIRPLVDTQGRTPPKGSPAYQQVLFGRPTWQGERDELLYLPRYRRTNSLYGRSPTEDVMMTINRALRRASFDLNYYAASNIPEAIVPLAADFTPDQIRTFQEWFDMIVTAPERRRSLHFIPAGPNFRPFQFKEPILDTAVEEFLDRRVHARFQVAPNELGMTVDVNKSTGATQENVTQRRMLPILRYVSACLTVVAHAANPKWKVARFRFKAEAPAEDRLAEAEVHDRYIKAGVFSVDEVLEEIGREPIGASKHLVYLASGPVQVPLGIDKTEEQVAADEATKSAASLAQQKELLAAKQPPVVVAGQPDDAKPDEGQPSDAKPGDEPPADEGDQPADKGLADAAQQLRRLAALVRSGA